MLKFIKNCFLITTAFIICNFLNVNSLECFSANNQEYKIRTEMTNININININIDLMQKAMILMMLLLYLLKGICLWYMSKNNAIVLMTNSNLKDKNGTL